MLRIIYPQKAAHNEILIKRQQVNFRCVCFCPMLRIISPQKAAHNEILVKRQQVNFRCVSYVKNYLSTKGCTQ